MKQAIKCFLVAIAAVFISANAFAQVTTSSLGGSIVDKNGEPIVGAAVVATHVPSGTVYGAAANTAGRYTIQGMRPGGPYKVEISCLGYQTVTITDVTLSLAESYNISKSLNDDAQMLASAIVVSEAASRFAAEKTGAATNINNEQITNLPTVSRSISDITRLSPYGGNGMTFAGADGRTANFTVDGADFNNNFGLSSNLPGGGNPISIDAIEEIQVVISPFDVRQTNFIGGGVNAITKSGTNTFKGSAYVYHRNENMRGDAVYGQEISGARATDRSTTYGFTLGGPIVKNKLFFFVNGEYAKSPTIANRWKGSQNGVANSANYVSRTTLSDLQQVSDFVKTKYGYDTGSYTSFPADENNMKLLARIDWNINDKHKLALRYNYTLNNKWTAPNATSMDGGIRSSGARTSQYSMSFANSMYSQLNLVNTWSLDLNSRLSDKLSNQFLATYSKLDDIRGTNSDEFPFIDILDGDIAAEGATPQAYMSLGYELFTWKNGVHNTVINVKDDLTYFAGTHKITGGLSFEYQMADNAYMRNGTGYYRYNSLSDFLNEAAPQVVCLTYGYDGETAPAVRVRFYKTGLYGQDEWQVNDNFKLTYGLRIDGLFFDNQDLMTNNAILNLDYYAENSDVRHVDTGKWPTSNIILSPRVGFNWDVLGDRSLKVRGGTGLFSGRLPLVFFTNMPSNGGLVQYQAQIGPTIKYNNLPESVKAKYPTIGDMLNQFQGGLITSTSAFRDKLIGMGYPETVSPEDGTVPSAVNGVDPSFKMPQVWKTSLAIDYALPTSFPFTLSAEGIFNKTINGVCISDWSIKPVGGFARFNGADNRPIFPTDFRTGTKAFMLENTNKGYGWSGVFQMAMTPIDGLDLSASYTHTVSKEITGMPGSAAESAFTYVATTEGPNNIKLHNSQYVTPDRFAVSATYSDKSNNSFNLFYEAWRGGYNYSYMVQNDMNGDGYPYDALYIPTEEQIAQGDFRFVSADDANRFMAFAKNDNYLSKHFGEYAEAYSVYNPWVQRVDFSYKHDFKVTCGNNTNTLQLSFDVKNVLNLINSSWGVTKALNTAIGTEARIMKYEGVDAEGYATFSTPAAINGSLPTFTPLHDLGQCWYASVGIKYIFN